MQLQLTLSTASKQCTKCGESHPLTNFSKDRSRPDGLFSWCKPCSRKSVAERYNGSEQAKVAHKEAQRRLRSKGRGESVTFERKLKVSGERNPSPFTTKTRKAATKKVERVARRDFSRAVKVLVGCQMCGEREPVVLDFHHIDPSSKLFIIARQGRFQSFQRLIDEIMKCCCVCANCHRKHHFGIVPIDSIHPITRRQVEQVITSLNDAKGVQ